MALRSPVIVAISGTGQPASANIVTAVPRRSWKWRPAAISAALAVSAHVAWKSRFNQAHPDGMVRIFGERCVRGVAQG